MMKSKEIFINYDIKAIKQLLKEMGKERYEAALKDAGLFVHMKPTSMSHFFLEWEDGKTFLCIKYPISPKFRLMNVLGFWAIPKEGWELRRVYIEN